ncbi:MAG TPA: tetraacyldisaccharide 4'-kinase, partial [Nitrospiraceae bacterium]|nr:tetraacyldisaccharide 4'-kinase [Nitrospiraceae bacterium]
EALKRGLRPCILTRGYKGKAKGPCFVSKGDGPLMDCREAGDEPILMADRLNSVPIVKCADRYKGGMFALSSLQRSNAPFLFILDDGFQHIS